VGSGYIETINVATLALKGTAPAISSATSTTEGIAFSTGPVAADANGIIIGAQQYGVSFDDSTSFQNFGTTAGSQASPVLFSPNAGPLAGGTTSSPYGFFALIPDIWYRSMRGSSSIVSNTLTITSPPSSTPGPVNLKYLFPDGTQIFSPRAFTYSTYFQFPAQIGSSPMGGAVGQVAGYGLPTTGGTGSVSVGGATAVIGTQTGQFASAGEFSSTFLKFDLPAGAPGVASLQVTTPNGSATWPGSILYAKSVNDYAYSDTFTDLLFDSTRNQVYLSAGNHIDVFSLSSGQFIAPLVPASKGSSSSFSGLALTPDGTTLLAANISDGTLGIINPDTPSQTSFIYIAAPTGLGTTCVTGPVSVSGLANGQALVSYGLPPVVGGCSQPNKLYLAKLQTGTVSLLTGCGGTQIESTADGSISIIGIESGGSCLYTTATGTFVTGPTDAYSYYGVSIAKDGNLAAVSNTFSDASGNASGLVGQPTVFYGSASSVFPEVTYPAGLLYHPRLNASGSLFFWAFPSYFDIVDGPTGTLRLRFPLTETIQSVETPMAIDDAGQHIFLITDAGLTVVDLGSALLGIGHITPATASSGNTVQIRGSGFVKGCTVTVGGQPATVSFVDQDTLNLILPTLASGPHDVIVSNPTGSPYTLPSGIIYP
jgi:hypothetical protein